MKLGFITMCAMMCISLTATADNYGLGFEWNAAEDWTARPAGDTGTSNGNPDDDAFGNPVWSYEYYNSVEPGSRLDTAKPWYTYDTVPMTWVSSWYGQPGKWTANGDTPTATDGIYMTSKARQPRFALMRWINPSTTTKRVRVVNDEASVSFGAANDVTDFMIGHWDESAGVLKLLYTETVHSPDNYSYPNNRRTYFAYDVCVTVDPGDSIIWSGYSVGSADYTGVWANPSVEVVSMPFAGFYDIVTSVNFGDESDADHLFFSGNIQLAAGSNGINPDTDDVVIHAGPITVTIPAGSMQVRGDKCIYNGEINDVHIKAMLTQYTVGNYSFTMLAHGVDLTGWSNPEEWTLIIGDDIGEKKQWLKGNLHTDYE